MARMNKDMQTITQKRQFWILHLSGWLAWVSKEISAWLKELEG